MSDTTIDQLGNEHRDLRKAVSDLSTQLSTSIAKVDGKVDRAIALMERANERQDRSEIRADRLEAQIETVRDRAEERLRDQQRIHDRKIGEIEGKQEKNASHIAMAIGALTLATFAIPLVINFLI